MTENKMTETEIMKALECCKMPVGSGACNHCPLKETREKRVSNEDKSCTTIALESALDLINRKNAEIEQFADIGKLYSEIKAEARAEAIKEFAERVKEATYHYYDADIDEIAKEMGVEL